MKADYSKYKDSELFAALKDKKETAEGAFAEIYARFSQKVFVYCLRVTGSHEDARDIFQETFLKFYETCSGYKIVDNIMGYLLIVARNICLNYKRKNSHAAKIEDYFLTSNDRTLEHRETQQMISSALELLDFEYREAFILRQYHGLDYNEIALITGDTVYAVKNRVWRAKEKLQVILAPYFFEEVQKQNR